ncbi:MAG: dihydrofolate reductase [Proteobacteria bacterium]|uniref:Dihydrofolate reductase n=1 Tax=Candidatus Avisuccinivibrio stercorigallinarum TaxID=2840704 RepID=A0A9D9DBF4_9GAMM|nr:dihydrofolate reductase [Candidatus Avisuccinivibrio stercorigallinarum]
MAQLELIVCMDRNRVIGFKGHMPWYFKTDLQRFKAVTYCHPILMGRRTFESVGKALPGRRNIVVSSKKIDAPDIEVVHSLDEAVALVDDRETLIVIGGQRLYESVLPRAVELNLKKLHVTRILNQAFEGDTYFPHFSALPFKRVACEQHHDLENDFDYTFETWALI